MQIHKTSGHAILTAYCRNFHTVQYGVGAQQSGKRQAPVIFCFHTLEVFLQSEADSIRVST